MLESSAVQAGFRYDPSTGELWRRKRTCNARMDRPVGTVAAGGYLMASFQSRPEYVHRLIFVVMMGREPREMVDHKNGIKTDNRWCNLRESTRSENAANLRKINLSKAGYKGVGRIRDKWRARLYYGGKVHHLGMHDTPELAAQAYDKKAREVFGEFASTNFPD